MKAESNPDSKKQRGPSLPEDEIPHLRYYNQAAIGLKILFDLAADGEDLEYLERLKRVCGLIIELAGAEENLVGREVLVEIQSRTPESRLK